MLRAAAFALVALLGLAACRTEAPAPPPAPPTPPPTVEAPPTAAPEAPVPEAPVPEALREEVAAEVRRHALTAEDVARYGRATEAVARRAEEEPELRQLWEELEGRLREAQSLEEVEQVLDADPRVQRVLREAGLSSRDYVLTGTALLGAYQVVLAREAGDPVPPRPDYVTDAHLRFVERHRAEVEAIVAHLQALYGTDFDDFFPEEG